MSAVTHDVVIVGAGPAGMSAALELVGRGASVLVLDEQAGPGGQIFRAVERERPGEAAIFGAERGRGRDLVARYLAGGVDHRRQAAVWSIDGGEVAWVSPQGGGRAVARHVVVATGALERPVPIEGWTLPGVMSVGAAQSLLKDGGVAAQGAVFAGSGPLLLLTAVQYLRAGTPPALVLDTTPASRIAAALPHLAGAALAPGDLLRGVGLLAELLRAGVPVVRGVEGIAAHGATRLAEVTWRREAEAGRIATEHLFLHQGVVPHLAAALAAGATEAFDPAAEAWRPIADGDGRTERPGVWVAGDAGGIGGATAAIASGRRVGLAVAADLGLSVGRGTRLAAGLAAARARAPRPFVDALFRPRPEFLLPAAETTHVCRCEGVNRGEVVAAIADGAHGPAQLKAYTRAGMGACHGRYCRDTVARLVAAERGEAVGAVPPASVRSPLVPVTLGDIAAAAALPDAD